MEPGERPNAVPRRVSVIPKREVGLISEQRKPKLKGITPKLLDPIIDTTLKSASSALALVSSRLKIDFHTISNPCCLAGHLEHFLANWRLITEDTAILLKHGRFIRLTFTC